MDASKEKYIIFGCDLFTAKGGVSDYTDNLASQLHIHGLLRYVVTPHGRLAASDYEIRKFNIKLFRGTYWLDKWFLTRKIITFFYYLAFYFKTALLLRKMKEPNATIIFTEYYTDKFDIIIFVARLLGIRYIVVFHGLDIITISKNSFRHGVRNIAGAKKLVFNSIATRDLFVKTFSIDIANSVILYPGIDLTKVDRFSLSGHLQRNFKEKDEQLVFSSVCYLGTRKGIDKAIRIVSSLHSSYGDIRYYIAGEGPERTKLESLVKELDACNYISFLGRIEDDEKYNLLRESDVFLLPNYSVNNTDFEGFGISFIEASLCGNVIIGGNHGGAKEAVSHNQTGFLFNFDDDGAPEQARKLLRDLMADKTRMNKIKEAGIEYVRLHYCWQNIIQQFIASEKV